MRKETYYDLEMEIIRFDSEDIVTASLPDSEETGDDNTEDDFD